MRQARPQIKRLPPTIAWLPLLAGLQSSGGGRREAQILGFYDRERQMFKGQLDSTLLDYVETNETIGSALMKMRDWPGMDDSLFDEVKDPEDFIRIKSGDRKK